MFGHYFHEIFMRSVIEAGCTALGRCSAIEAGV